jgi:hypothetical protein
MIARSSALGLPGAFAALPKKDGAASSGMPTPRGFAGLSVPFLVMMFIVSVLGGTLATNLAGRLKWYPVLVVCAAIDLVTVVVLGMRPTAVVFPVLRVTRR